MNAGLPRQPRSLAVLFASCGVVGLLAAAILLVEKLALLRDPTYVPSCSINPVLSCGSVMETPQAEVFGFPNPIMGVAGFAVVTTVGVALLAGASFARWFWVGLQCGLVFGVVLVHWMIFQSLYRIEALCPYCMAVWVVTIPIFWYGALYNLAAGNLGASPTVRGVGRRLGSYHAVVLTGWYLVILSLITIQFWHYWQTLLR